MTVLRKFHRAPKWTKRPRGVRSLLFDSALYPFSLVPPFFFFFLMCGVLCGDFGGLAPPLGVEINVGSGPGPGPGGNILDPCAWKKAPFPWGP